MVAQFPSQSSESTSNNIDSLLIPNLEIFVNVTDVGSSQAAPLQPGQQISDSIERHSRIVELQVKAKGIQVSLIKPAIQRIFTYATNAIINDMNITTGADVGLPLNPYSPPTNNPKINVIVTANRSSRDKTIDLELVILNLKADSIFATFDRLTAYLDEAITRDLNPSI